MVRVLLVLVLVLVHLNTLPCMSPVSYIALQPLPVTGITSVLVALAPFCYGALHVTLQSNRVPVMRPQAILFTPPVGGWPLATSLVPRVPVLSYWL